jgi:hypothetical protein
LVAIQSLADYIVINEALAEFAACDLPLSIVFVQEMRSMMPNCQINLDYVPRLAGKTAIVIVALVCVFVTSSCIFDSPDLRKGSSKWRSAQLPTRALVRSISWSEELQLFAAFADGPEILLSSDGISWTKIDSTKLPPLSFRGSMWDGKRFVVSAASHFIEIEPGHFVRGDSIVALSSVDGVTWQEHRHGNLSFMTQLASSDTLIVGAGTKSGIIIATDYDSWKRINWYQGPHHSIFAVAWVRGTFIIGGEFGMIRTSTDGLNWKTVNNWPFKWIRKIAASDSIIVALGDAGFSLTSTDAKTWVDHATSIPVAIQDMIWADSEFIAVGDGAFSSKDGAHWRTDIFPGFVSLRSIAASGEIIVAVGWDGRALVRRLD